MRTRITVAMLLVMVMMLLSSLETEARRSQRRRQHWQRGRGIRFAPSVSRYRQQGHSRPQRDKAERAPSFVTPFRPAGRMRNLWNSLFRFSDNGGGFDFVPFGGFGRRLGFASQRHPWNSDFDFGSDFGRQKDWWDGPNVCRSEEKKNGSDGASSAVAHHFKTSTQVCESSDTSYKCTTTVQSAEGAITKVELHECCHGYSRKPEEFGCQQKLQLSDLPTTARDLGLNDLLTAVRQVGLEEELARGNFTIFAPVDGAFPPSSLSSDNPKSSRLQFRDQYRAWRDPESFLRLRDQPRALNIRIRRPPLRDDEEKEKKIGKLENQPRAWRVRSPLRDEDEEEEEEERKNEELENIVLGHLIPEPRRASSFSDEDVLETGNPKDSTIRMNFYSRPEKLTTANCVKVTSSDNMATNGVIHVVEKALPMVTSSLVDLLRSDKQFSYLKTAIARANLLSSLQADGQFTLFAPTNVAFQRLDKGLLDKLLSGDSQCLTKVLQHHVLPNVICSTVIQGLAKSLNLANSYVNLTRTEDGKLFVNDAQVVRADVMATNGVMHVIDAVIIPDDALDVVSVAKKNGLTELIQLTDEAGLTSSLHNASDVTIFGPSNEAIQALTPEVQKKLKADPELLQSVLQYHVVPERLTCRHVYQNKHLDTLNPKGRVFVKEYSSFPFGRGRVTTVQCAPIITQNVPSCNGVIHVIDRVLLPPPGNIIDVLAADSSYSILVRLLKKAGIADSLQDEGPFTLFAPTNEAFQQLGKDTMKELEGNSEQLASLLKTHIADDHLCCAGIFNNPWWHAQRIASQNGRSISLSRDRRGRPLVSDAVIGSCDNMATNGVVHAIESVLVPRRRRNPWYMFP